MAPPKVSDAAVADALTAAFRDQGYAGASISDLAKATGLRSASLYHRFPAKSDMALAALERATADFAVLVIAPLLRPQDDPDTRLRLSAKGIDRFYEGGRLACLLAVFSGSDVPGAVRGAVASAFAGWRDALARALGEAGHADPVAEAEDRIAGVQGGLILARATGELGGFARAVEKAGATP